MFQYAENECVLKRRFSTNVTTRDHTKCQAMNSRPTNQLQTEPVNQTYSAGIPRYDEKSTTGRSQMLT